MSDCRKCLKAVWCAENEDCCLFTPKPQTNADRIRAMTDEELATFLEPDGNRPWYRCGNCKFSSCVDCALDWLKEEVKHE